MIAPSIIIIIDLIDTIILCLIIVIIIIDPKFLTNINFIYITHTFIHFPLKNKPLIIIIYFR